MTNRIEAQVERFAPGFRDRILARSAHPRAALVAYDPNYIGGDINAGVSDMRQLVFRPIARSLLDRFPRPLPVLIVDAARRRSPRDGRLPGGAVRPSPRAALGFRSHVLRESAGSAGSAWLSWPDGSTPWLAAGRDGRRPHV
jgi:hypothetical protein